MTVATLVAVLSAGPAHALGQWAVKVEKDPFSGGELVTVDLLLTIQSAVMVFCDTRRDGLHVRVIPGYEYPVGAESESTMEFAIDGKRVGSAPATLGETSVRLATADALLDREAAAKFVEAFAQARSQVAIQDGFSSRPHLLTADGSAEAGAALRSCLALQDGAAPDTE